MLSVPLDLQVIMLVCSVRLSTLMTNATTKLSRMDSASSITQPQQRHMLKQDTETSSRKQLLLILMYTTVMEHKRLSNFWRDLKSLVLQGMGSSLGRQLKLVKLTINLGQDWMMLRMYFLRPPICTRLQKFKFNRTCKAKILWAKSPTTRERVYFTQEQVVKVKTLKNKTTFTLVVS